MPIRSSFLGPTTISGDEAKAFSQKLLHARGSRAASVAAIRGKRLVVAFEKAGVVTVNLQSDLSRGRKRPGYITF